jgi:BCD family chlorophyll transporter-like MFS transporter
MSGEWLGWRGIVRLGLVQSAVGAVVVLMTSTLNRVMVVEMSLPASLPAALVAWHYALQLSRPRWGHGFDSARNRGQWIIIGMGVLVLGAILAANATVIMAEERILGLILGIVAFAMIGAGVAGSGTSLLALMASRVAPERRPAAAAIAWIMMIFGIVLTAGVSGQVLDPYSPQRLVLVASGISAIAFIVTLLAMRGLGTRPAGRENTGEPGESAPFIESLRQIWQEPLARSFTLFVFISMLAYSAQELILEPYAGLLFGYSLGQSTQLAGFQHGGVLVGMVLVGLMGTLLRGDRTRFMKGCTVFGCCASAAAMIGLTAAGLAQPVLPLPPIVFGLGFANGIFACSALGLMMSFAGARRDGGGQGIRMGLWGAAQALAFAIGGFAGASGLDLMRHWLGTGASAFAVIFSAEAACFLIAAVIALTLGRTETAKPALLSRLQEGLS